MSGGLGLLEQIVEEGVEGGILADDGLKDLAVGADDDLGGEARMCWAARSSRSTTAPPPCRAIRRLRA